MAEFLHPFAHLLLGESPHFLLVKYDSGVSNMDKIVQVLDAHSVRRSASVSHLSGNYDLGMQLWIPQATSGERDRLAELKDELARCGAAKIEDYPLEHMSTPGQRHFEEKRKRAFSITPPDILSKGNAGAPWTVKNAHTHTRPDLNSLLKFHIVLQTRTGDAVRVFRSLCTSLQAAEDTYQHWSVATYRQALEEGCIVTAYTSLAWPSLRTAIIELLGLKYPVESATYLCFDEPIADDLPWMESCDKHEGGGVPEWETLEIRGCKAIAGLFELDNSNMGQVLNGVVMGPLCRRSLTTYLPGQWWTFKRNVRSLVRCIGSQDAEAFVRDLREQYVEIDRHLCDATRALFRTGRRTKKADDLAQKAELERAALSHLGITVYESRATELGDVVERVTKLTLSKDDRTKLTRMLRKVIKDYRGFAKSEARFMLGGIGQVIRGLADSMSARPSGKGGKPKQLLEFGDKGIAALMDGWRDNLARLARHRNLLVHGEVVDPFSPDPDSGRPYYVGMLETYIRTVPQVHVLLDALHRAKRAHAFVDVEATGELTSARRAKDDLNKGLQSTAENPIEDATRLTQLGEKQREPKGPQPRRTDG